MFDIENTEIKVVSFTQHENKRAKKSITKCVYELFVYNLAIVVPIYSSKCASPIVVRCSLIHDRFRSADDLVGKSMS